MGGLGLCCDHALAPMCVWGSAQRNKTKQPSACAHQDADNENPIALSWWDVADDMDLLFTGSVGPALRAWNVISCTASSAC